MTVDLHLHSVYSDGLLSPLALCRLAARRGCEVIALCDHDTTNGLNALDAACHTVNAELAAQPEAPRALSALRGIELSAGPDGRTHILGYGVDAENEPLQAALTRQRKLRRERDEEILSRLISLGRGVPRALLPKDESLPLGRAHIARAMVEVGHVSTVEEAFERYLGDGKPAYVPFCHISAEEAAALLAAASAVPVLAHPARMRLEPQLLESLLDALTRSGLRGLECYHPSASHGQARAFAAIARRRGLLVTGGSDYHGDRGAHARLGQTASGWRCARADADALMDAIDHPKELLP